MRACGTFVSVCFIKRNNYEILLLKLGFIIDLRVNFGVFSNVGIGRFEGVKVRDPSNDHSREGGSEKR